MDTEQAACVGSDPAKFFPETQRELRAAQAYCERCPIADLCREQGEVQKFGVWGGLLWSNGKTVQRISNFRRAA